jgi:hypothetical protein
MRSLIVWSLGLVAQTVRMQSLGQDRKSIAALPTDPWDMPAGSGAVENEFHFQDARMVF